MSLIRIAARIAAVEALKGATLVGDNVLDSRIGALDVDDDNRIRTDQEKPFIAVYTDAGTTKDNDITSRATLINGVTEILFEAGITAAHVTRDNDTGEDIIIEGVPATDDAMEFYLDIVARQIADAITAPQNEWGELLRRFVIRPISIERARTASREQVRLAGQQVKWNVELIADPLKGQVLGANHALREFFAKVNAGDDAALKAKIAKMQSTLETDVNDFEWQAQQRRHGMTMGEMRALLLDMQAGAEADIAIVETNTKPAEIVQPQ